MQRIWIAIVIAGCSSKSPPAATGSGSATTGSATGSGSGSAMAGSGSAATGSGSAAAGSGSAAPAAPVLALPGGTADGIGMDYLAFDPRTNTVWVPAGNTGSVDVVDDATGKIQRIEGFKTQEMERRGHKRIVGPSSVTLGAPGTVYVGNRGDFSVCAIDEKTLKKGTCSTLDSMPDGIQYVAPTKEVWVTAPRDKTIRILDGATLAQKAKLTFEGEPEGFAADPTRGRFYTNLEDKDATLAIDIKTHKTVATWQPKCGEDGPHGLRLDEKNGLLVIACSTKVEAMDVKTGAITGSVDTGDGVDDIDFLDGRVYAGAAKAAKLTVASLDPKGAMAVVSTTPTADGARNGVATTAGKVYLSHSKGSELVVIPPAGH